MVGMVGTVDTALVSAPGDIAQPSRTWAQPAASPKNESRSGDQQCLADQHSPTIHIW